MEILGGIDLQQENDTVENKIVSMEDKRPKRRPFHIWKVEDTDYKLKLTTSVITQLESKYRRNLMTLLTEGDLPPLAVMLTVTQGAMAPWNHGIKYTDVQRIYDQWTEKGGSQMEFYTNVVIPTLAVSGFFTESQTDSIMNSLKESEILT